MILKKVLSTTLLIIMILSSLTLAYYGFKNLISSSSTIYVKLDSKIRDDNSTKDVALYEVYISACSPDFYSARKGERVKVPIYRYIVKPSKEILVNTEAFEKIWAPYVNEIRNAIDGNKASTVQIPCVYVNIIAITKDLKRYTFSYIATSKSAIVSKLMAKNKRINSKTLSSYVMSELKRDPLAVFHGYKIEIHTSEVKFTRSTIDKIILSRVNSTKEKTHRYILESKPYSPYDPNIIGYLHGNIGFLDGSIFSVDSPWYKLYSSRNTPPNNWSKRIIVNGGLDKSDVVRGTWYQLAYYFSGVFYINLNLVNHDISRAIEMLNNYAINYIPASGIYHIGDADLLSLLYARYKGTNAYYDIDWINSYPTGKIFTFTEPIGAVHIYKGDDYAEYIPGTDLIFTWLHLSVLTEITTIGGSLASICSNANIEETIDKIASTPRSTSTEAYMALIWDKYEIYVCDKAAILYDYSLVGTDDSDPNNDYLLLIPYIVFFPGTSSIYLLDTIRTIHGIQSWNEYVEPYRWNIAGIILRGDRIFTGGTDDDLLVSYSFIHNNNIRYTHTLGEQYGLLINVVKTIIGTYDPTKLTSYFTLLIDTFTEQKFSLARDLDVFQLKLIVKGDPSYAGYHVYVWGEKVSEDAYDPSKDIVPIYRVVMHSPNSPSPPPCDPVTGNCPLGFNNGN